MKFAGTCLDLTCAMVSSGALFRKAEREQRWDARELNCDETNKAYSIDASRLVSAIMNGACLLRVKHVCRQCEDQDYPSR